MLTKVFITNLKNIFISTSTPGLGPKPTAHSRPKTDQLCKLKKKLKDGELKKYIAKVIQLSTVVLFSFQTFKKSC